MKGLSVFQTQLQQFQFYNKYARFDHNLGRRETWEEAVRRASDYLRELSEDRLSPADYQEIHDGILNLEVMPSMRLLAMAGPAARRNNMAIYNCSYLPVDSIESFSEALLISMAGCGVGYSVESRYINRLPMVERFDGTVTHFSIPDTTEGWAEAVKFGIRTWLSGSDVVFDYSRIRPAGSILRVKGGRASGPEPLRRALEIARGRIKARQWKRLRPIDAHDIMCAIGGAAIAGGVRRSAMIALFDWDDEAMRHCKDGDFWVLNPQRWNANNSVVWPEEGVDSVGLTEQMLSMFHAQRGEPGIFNRAAARRLRPEGRLDADFGTNPCGEIVLRPYQFCNLSIAVARPDDTSRDLARKVRLATIIGTIQAMATDFPGMRPIWKENCEEERLIGVDITGQMDCKHLRGREAWLTYDSLRTYVKHVNVEYAEKLGINPAAARTCVKPSGNSSVLLDCSPGIHPRWAKYYIRNVRIATHAPLFGVLRDSFVPMDPENGQTEADATTWVVHFPAKAPVGATTRSDLSAIQQCENWKLLKAWWTDHNPSVTITYKPDEFVDLLHWVWQNREIIGGMAFFPDSGAEYEQMPYEEIEKELYEELAAEFPKIDFSLLSVYEKDDNTTSAQEVACSAGTCDLVL